MAADPLPTVLFVEDEPLLTRALERLTREDSRYHFVFAESGAEGLRKARRQAPCAIVLDMVLGDMDGRAFLQELRGSPALAQVPVVVISATLSEWQPLVRAEAFLPKPCAYAAILAAVDGVLLPSGSRLHS